MLHMREAILKNDDFNEIFIELESFESIWPGILDSFTLKSYSQFADNIKVEFIENHSLVFSQFASIVEFFHRPISENFDCSELKKSTFDGNYNSKILLKYMLVLFDPLGELRKCIIEDDPDSSNLNASHEIEITPKYLENQKSKGPENFKISNATFMNVFTLGSLLEIKKKIEIDKCYVGVYKILHDLEMASRGGSMTKSFITQTIEFISSKWNQVDFEYYMYEGFKTGMVKNNLYIFQKYLNILNPFGELYDKMMKRLNNFYKFFNPTISNMNNVSGVIIKTSLDLGHKFPIKDYKNLIALIRKLGVNGHLNERSLSKLVEFEYENNKVSYSELWKSIFRKFLEMTTESEFVPEREFKFYKDLFK